MSIIMVNNPLVTHKVDPRVYLFEELFVDWTDSGFPDDWVYVGTPDASNFWEESVGNGARTVSDGSTVAKIDYLVSQIPLVTSTTYYYEIVIHSIVKGGMFFGDGTPAIEANMNAVQTYSGSFVKGSATNMNLKRVGDTDMVIASLRIDTSSI